MESINLAVSDKAKDAKPLAVVVLSGEQLWPSIHGILHWHRALGKVQEVFIYPTQDVAPLSGATLRLKRFLEQYFTGLRIVLHTGLPAATPQEIRSAVLAWMGEYPDRQWLLIGTGGGKGTVLSLAGFAGTAEVQVVYQELSGEWFELARAPEGQTWEARKLEGIQPQETDVLPVTDLVCSQFSIAADATEFTAEPVESLPVKRLTQEGIVQAWNWPATFAASGLKSEYPSDFLFGNYVAAGLRELGVSNLVRNLKLSNKRDRKEKRELDLVVNQGGRVLVLDLKLLNETGEPAGANGTMIAQLRQAADTRQWLSGLGTQVVVVRPCRTFNEAERELAKAYSIDVIDQRDAPKLFSRLAGWLGITDLAPEMAEVEAMLVEQVTQRGRLRVFGPEPDRTREQETDSGAPEWVDIDTYLNRLRKERRQNWMLWTTRTEIYLLLERPAAAPAELPSLIQTALSSFGRVRVETTQNGYEVIFPRESSRLAKLRQALAGFVNRRLETMVFVQVRPQKPSPPVNVLRAPTRSPKEMNSPVFSVDGYGSLDDLDAEVEKVFKPKQPPKT